MIKTTPSFSLPVNCTSSEENVLYPKHKTLSTYVRSFDTTRLAVDVTFPLNQEGNIVSPLPVIVLANRSCRRSPHDYGISLGHALVSCGFIFVSLELRGCGVSYGINDSFGSHEHCKDLISVINWIHTKNWCSGKVGLLGASNRAYIQLCTAAMNPDGLSAITPVVAVSDFYYQNYPNGVSAVPSFRMPVADHLLSKGEFLENNVPVDEDPEGTLAYDAFITDQFGKNKDFFETLCLPHMNRDTPHPLYNNEKINMTLPAYGKLSPFFHDHDIKMHQFIGEIESGTLGQLAHYIDFGGSVILGPWDHGDCCTGQSSFEDGQIDTFSSYLEWYQASLKKDIHGFFNAPSVFYYMFNAPHGKQWRVSESWPPQNENRARLYLCAESDTTNRLTPDKPEASSCIYTVRTDISVFPDDKGVSTYNRSHLFWDGDMTSSVDEKGLCFTSAPLFPVYQNEMAGCISLDLWISCSTPDVDLIVYAEEIQRDGTSHYIKDGVLRASHRTTGSNPAWEKMGAFWHTSMTEDVDRCLSEGLEKPTHLQFAIDPIAWHFAPESRLRITITCANTAVYQHPDCYKDTPVLTVYTGGEYASFISVPFLEQTFDTYFGTISPDNMDAVLYVFDEHIYLHADHHWNIYKRPHKFTISGSQVLLGEDKLIFTPYGTPSNFPYFPTHGFPEKKSANIFPFVHKFPVAEVPVRTHERNLFVPLSKHLYFDLFKKETDIPQPCIIYIHGYGSAYNALPKQLLLLYDKGYAIAAIDIRNYPPNLFPDYIHDAKGAIRMLRANADTFGLDPDRFGIYGFSLGGNSSLMVLVSGDRPELEGTVGGNTTYSSRIQAGVAGFAWSDLLNMGKDIAEEFSLYPEYLADKIRMTDGEYSPSAEVIGFAGPDKGLGKLRAYKENGCQPSNALLDQKLAEAQKASPNSYIDPSAPPIALFGGYGDVNVNIALKQSFKTFYALTKADVVTYFFANNGGNYGKTQEVMDAICTFFDNHLKQPIKESIFIFRSSYMSYCHNYVSHSLQAAPIVKDDGFWILKSDVTEIFPASFINSCKKAHTYIDLLSGELHHGIVKYYPDYATLKITYKL